MSPEGIKPLSIGELLNAPHARYRIPMYQRRYAWGQTEVEQLLYDLLSCPQDKPYYIGSLVVFKHVTSQSDLVTYEVIDGQQRLTTLILLAACLRLSYVPIDMLEFENRPKSQAALRSIFSQSAAPSSHQQGDDHESAPALIGNYRLIEMFLQRDASKINRNELSEFLCKHVKIMRIEVPPHTDVAHYFEIMNNRGEQLEMHEIVKARLLSALRSEPEARATLNQVWDACANMNQYVHFGFATEKRKGLFGYDNDYDYFLPGDDAALIKLLGDGNAAKFDGISLRELINKSGSDEKNSIHSSRDNKSNRSARSSDEEPDRFQSIVNFPNFLLLVLTIFAEEKINNESTLDDKKLLSNFDSLLLSASNKETQVNRIKKFTFTLLRCRFLLDQFVIKRGLDDEDILTLKCVSQSGGRINQEATFSRQEEFNRPIQMLQAAFHVSHPRQAYKYWLLGTIHWLNQQSRRDIQGHDFLNYLESLAAAFMRDRYLVHNEETKISYLDIVFRNAGQAQSLLGGSIASCLTYQSIDNIFVFNYLDYLLWQENKKQKEPDKLIKEFKFKIRGSVEHYYPQNPRDGQHWPDVDLHAFGNLCLVSHEKNARLSDHLPLSKNEYYVGKPLDSIKQHKMMQITKNSGDWNSAAMKSHENAMIEVISAKLSTQPAVAIPLHTTRILLRNRTG